MFRNLLIFVAVLGVAVYFFARRRRPQRLFEIRVGEGDVEVYGPIPDREQGAVQDYVHGLRLPVGAKITGFPTGSGFELRFSNSIRADDRDRVRAFLKGSNDRMLH